MRVRRRAEVLCGFKKNAEQNPVDSPLCLRAIGEECFLRYLRFRPGGRERDLPPRETFFFAALRDKEI
jgi:hypothetical protein